MVKKILFIGMPDMATVCLNKLLDSNINIKAVILPDKTNVSRETIRSIAKNKGGIEILEYDISPNESRLIEKIKALDIDLGVISSLNHKLSKKFLSAAHDGFINCHPSPLPHYRGANPYFHIILNNEQTGGITIHFADENFDTGEIIAQEFFPTMKKETMGMLFSRTNFMMADLLLKVLKQYEKDGKLESKPQGKGDFIKAPNIKGDLFINWEEDILKTERLIRAANPFYNAITNFRGGYIRIISGDYEIKKHKNEPGTILNVTKDSFKIASNGGFYIPTVIQAGAWGIYPVKEFIEKFSPKQNEILR